jgi:hypothetical protein
MLGGERSQRIPSAPQGRQLRSHTHTCEVYSFTSLPFHEAWCVPCRHFKTQSCLLPWFCLRGGGVPNLGIRFSKALVGEQSVATPQAARCWARPPCRHFKTQSCCCLGSANELPLFGSQCSLESLEDSECGCRQCICTSNATVLFDSTWTGAARRYAPPLRPA